MCAIEIDLRPINLVWLIRLSLITRCILQHFYDVLSVHTQQRCPFFVNDYVLKLGCYKVNGLLLTKTAGLESARETNSSKLEKLLRERKSSDDVFLGKDSWVTQPTFRNSKERQVYSWSVTHWLHGMGNLGNLISNITCVAKTYINIQKYASVS